MEHIHPIQPIAVIILAIVFWYIRKQKLAAKGGPAKKTGQSGTGTQTRIERPAKPVDPPEVVYANLRKRAFETSPQNLGSAGDVGESEAYGLIMEMGMADSVLTLACFADGEAGFFYQSGGGMKGGGAHENVRKAAKAFVALAQKALPQMNKTIGTPLLPDAGQVRFSALTPQGLLSAEVDRESLSESQSPFAALFLSGQEVVAQMRQVQAQKAS